MSSSSAPRTELPAVYDRQYPARRLLDLVGDKWTPVVLYSLSGSVKRFSAINREIPDISKKMLVQVLRSLEAVGVVERIVYPVVPPHTEYRLTADGEVLHAPVAALCEWAQDHSDFLTTLHERKSHVTPWSPS